MPDRRNPLPIWSPTLLSQVCLVDNGNNKTQSFHWFIVVLVIFIYYIIILLICNILIIIAIPTIPRHHSLSEDPRDVLGIWSLWAASFLCKKVRSINMKILMVMVIFGYIPMDKNWQTKSWILTFQGGSLWSLLWRSLCLHHLLSGHLEVGHHN